MNAKMFLAAAALAIACENPSRATEPVWGKQTCAYCSMILSQPRFAAQLTTAGGERFFFDDPGCMAAWVRQHQPRVRSMWVREGNGWIDAKTARFRRGDKTPMDWGLAPAPDGTVGWSSVEQAVNEREPKP